MFLRYLDFVFVPFRAVRNKILGVKNIKGRLQFDVNRVKQLKARGARAAGQVGQMNQKFGQQAGQVHGGAQAMQQSGGQGAPGMQASGGGNAPDPNPPIRSKGFWIFKKKFCTQCDQQLDKSWDGCPFCAQIAAQIVATPAKIALRTQAFVLDSQGAPGSMQLLGWLVALQGPQKGELFTLVPVTLIGTAPTCNVVLVDKFMSAKHAEIKAEAGIWVLRDVGSTNGTYVNNKRVDRHELVDNDFVKFGSAMFKFKSL